MRFREWFDREVLAGRYAVGEQTSIDALVKASGIARSSVKIAVRDLVAAGTISTLRGHGITIRRIPLSTVPRVSKSIVFIARAASVGVSADLYKLIQDAFNRLTAPTPDYAGEFNLVMLPATMKDEGGDALRTFILNCDAAVVGGIRTDEEYVFLKSLFSKTRMPVVVVGSDRTVAEGQYIVTSNETEGSARLIEALLDRLVELSVLDQGKPKFLPPVILVTDDLNGRNRKRIDGCVSVLEEHAKRDIEPFAWNKNSIWHPEHGLVLHGARDKYVPARKGKRAGRYIGLRILDYLGYVDSTAAISPPSKSDSAQESSMLPRAVLVATNAEVAEGLAEACALRSVRVPREIILAATAGSFRRFGSFLTRSEPDSPAVAEAVAGFLFHTFWSPRPVKVQPQQVFPARLHLRRSSQHFLHSTWRHAPSLTIKRVDNQTGKITYLYGNPVFEYLSGKTSSETRGMNSVDVWGQRAGRPIAHYDQIVAGSPEKLAPRAILSAAWLPFQNPVMCRFTFRFPMTLQTRRFGDARLIGSLGFDMSISSEANSGQEIKLMPMPQYETETAIEYPDQELLQAFFESIPATVAVRTGRKIFYMNSTYACVFFGPEFSARRTILVIDQSTDGIGAYYDRLKEDPQHTVSKIGVHRLVRDQLFKTHKAPISPEEIGDRWVMRFGIADSVFEDGGEASFGFDADLIDGLARIIESADLSQPIENRYVEIVSHKLKGFASTPMGGYSTDASTDG
ncbi:MAG TPA: hypothetical protein VMF91_16975 [Bryobacteraceae bacterium]|nr:hypothetical protein [Bryobacteraceae bacterium]